jgi:hypothetical protein
MAEEGEDGVKIALEVCGATDDQITAIVAEGFEDMRDLLILDNKEIADMMAGITKLPVNRGGPQLVRFSQRIVRHLLIGAKSKRDNDLIWMRTDSQRKNSRVCSRGWESKPTQKNRNLSHHLNSKHTNG